MGTKYGISVAWILVPDGLSILQTVDPLEISWSGAKKQKTFGARQCCGWKCLVDKGDPLETVMRRKVPRCTKHYTLRWMDNNSRTPHQVQFPSVSPEQEYDTMMGTEPPKIQDSRLVENY